MNETDSFRWAGLGKGGGGGTFRTSGFQCHMSLFSHNQTPLRPTALHECGFGLFIFQRSRQRCDGERYSQCSRGISGFDPVPATRHLAESVGPCGGVWAHGELSLICGRGLTLVGGGGSREMLCGAGCLFPLPSQR